MKKMTHVRLPQILLLLAAVLVFACFGTAMTLIDRSAQKDCYDDIEKSTAQVADMFTRAMTQHKEHLEMFAQILEDHSDDPGFDAEAYLDTFQEIRHFTTVCLHRGDEACDHLHNDSLSFADELSRAPYISPVLSQGELREDQFIYLVVPVTLGDGGPDALLYGYLSLDQLPDMVSSSDYGGHSQLYLLDGNTGDFLIFEYAPLRTDAEGHEIPLGNAFDSTVSPLVAKQNADLEDMRQGMATRQSGYFIFQGKDTGRWYYAYYTPLSDPLFKEVNWSIHLAVDEATAFAVHNDIRTSVFWLMLAVVALAISAIIILIWQNHQSRRADQARLRRSDYINAVQSALISAHNNPDFVSQALHLIAKESVAETVLLLTFADRTIQYVYYWPSQDKTPAMALKGLNMSHVFPDMYDVLQTGQSLFVGSDLIEGLPREPRELLRALEVTNMLLVPIRDNAGLLKACLASVNIPPDQAHPEPLECLTRDFFLAITNLESYTIIKNMGAIDYLTGVKNRNSYESELPQIATWEADSLWCVFVDANGLHEINNTQGHSAGDQMLITVAKVLRQVLGDRWVYRLGGDEFVAFAKNSSHQAFMSFKHRILDELTAQGYYVSVGFEGAQRNANRVFDVEQTVKAAEALMYRDKMAFYIEHELSLDRARPRNELAAPIPGDRPAIPTEGGQPQ